jgi:hypothetical protein
MIYCLPVARKGFVSGDGVSSDASIVTVHTTGISSHLSLTRFEDKPFGTSDVGIVEREIIIRNQTKGQLNASTSPDHRNYNEKNQLFYISLMFLPFS